ncbi:MAG: hypothetical protein AAF518_07435 [Spirochaetota bacterium]
MKFISYLCLIYTLLTISIASEVPNTSYLYTPEPNEEKSKFVSLEQSISNKVFEIEKLHARIVPYNRSMRKEITIDNHITPFTRHKHETIRYEKETVLIFSANKLTKVKIISRKRFLNDNTKFLNKKFIFVYPDYDYSSLAVDNLDGHSLQYLKFFSEKNKLEALQKVDQNLQESIYKLEVLLLKYQKRRSSREKQKLDI